MTMQRFFIPPAWIRGNDVSVMGPQAHQIAHVLRMRPGDVVVFLDNSGWEIETRLSFVDSHAVRGTVVRRRLSTAEPHTKISLYQSVLKSNRLEYVLQKGTELGIVEFVPLLADRCVMSDLDALERKHERWERIIQEAAEQSRRGRKPTLRSAALLPQACEQIARAGGLSLILWEGEEQLALHDLLRSPRMRAARPFIVNLIVGPEGGFTASEVDVARRYDVLPVHLGPRILRAETAGIVAAAVILYELGDMA
jgi:16S rRNA (uracil1498-N3)-methyltransferase